MGGVFSNPLKSSLKDAFKDDEVMKPLRNQGIVLVKEISQDEDIKNQGVVWVRQIVQDKEIRVAGTEFVSEVLAKEDVTKQLSLVLKGVETNIKDVRTTLAIGFGIGLLLYGLNTIQNLFGKPPPPAAAAAASASAAAAAAASTAREAAATATFYTAALQLPRTSEE
ncbi:uncharacterized protein LOC113277220 [Papaver somniferum]|uniref:uncharacterized protein LOC113277220 n=1 Tax=Papaver somniferum TaxID=3469 RepID=UPI000E705064|nr:uncharacterized protein LOC113277220 [Papaver somniferum]